MKTFLPVAVAGTSYEEPDRVSENTPWLELCFGRRAAYLEFKGDKGLSRLKMAKLRLPAISVPYHSRIDVWGLKSFAVGNGLSWNETPVNGWEYIDTADFYRGRTGWYEVDVSSAFAGVAGGFHITFKLAAQTYPGREAIRLESGRSGKDKVVEKRESNCPHLVFVYEDAEEKQGETVPVEQFADAERGIGEDGYEMWLRYRPMDPAYCRENLQRFEKIYIESRFEKAIRYELSEALGKIAGIEPQWCEKKLCGAAIIEKAGMEEGSYTISEEDGMINVTGGGAGVLYGLFALLSHLRRRKSLNDLPLEGSPYFKQRIFSHWDNFDGSVERGYAGESFWNWRKPDDLTYRRYRDYGRFCASVAINGLVINNVNPDPAFISDENIPKLAVLAECLREYGIRIYASISFDTPILQGGLDTADPEDPFVQDFWKKKIESIYRLIPDFGGFCVKGDSEGQPGPLKYGRDHACGANMLAERLKPHGGIVLWRAFVYQVPGLSSDRACQACQVFQPLDGKFLDNVVLQIKNGPLDFQVNEPLSPLFGAMEHTKTGLEVQIALEYKGQSVHLFFVPKEIQRILLEESGNGTTASVCREVFNAVSNTGNDRNWTRYTMGQANFFAVGRLAFNPFLSLWEAEKEWIELTFSDDKEVSDILTGLLEESCSVYASYAAPYGLGFLCDRDTHFHPEPESRGAFHGCNGDGLGYDRTARGSGFSLQYREEQRKHRENVEETEEEQLLWYHHLPFKYRMKDGRTLIQSLYDSLFEGAEETLKMAERFQTLAGKMDEKRYREICRTLLRQHEEALVWRNNGLAYFHSLSGIPDEKGRQLRAEPVEIEVRTEGKSLCVRTAENGGRLYLIDAGLAAETRYLTERILSMAVSDGHGLCLKLDGRNGFYCSEKPELFSNLQAFLVTEDEFLVRGICHAGGVKDYCCCLGGGDSQPETD